MQTCQCIDNFSILWNAWYLYMFYILYNYRKRPWDTDREQGLIILIINFHNYIYKCSDDQIVKHPQDINPSYMHLYHNMMLINIFYMIICMIYVHILHIIYVMRETMRYRQAGAYGRGWGEGEAVGGRDRWTERQNKRERTDDTLIHRYW